ncbi:ankyrin repeat domain-containing protein [Ruegeria sp. 2205SS24-7]|uniref:ankyrin repeat domain-containing protein n=1 Tax=Ruegeria discodermiae TaxID=3064389 RepID=UPI0027421F29|nr:ankyrin repeat domain-containing protein [Ruegeria sp. 2205SS24-7]MDP5218363.1 ankyrin repeat domain-containing protein [Ruegeria sp. 2205SS24-7]
MTHSLDQLRRQAKTLRKAFAAGDARAIERVQTVLGQTRTLLHSAALHVIAHEAGYESWPKMKFSIETADMQREARAEQLKLALFQGADWRVTQLLTQTPDLADDAFGLLCALYRIDAVRDWLNRDPSIVNQTLQGPRRPILHLAFSRHLQSHPELEGDMIAVADALLAAGADVNDGYPSEPGSPHQLSALYGAIGHADNMVLAQWLLDRGADPNDGESLYHATELGHHKGLKMLLAAGADPRGTNALLRALDFNDHEAVGLLLDYGAQVEEFNDAPVSGEEPWVIPALHQAARRMCDGLMIDLLLSHGANPNRLYKGYSAYGFARVYGNAPLAQAIEAAGTPPRLTPEEELLAQAAEGRLQQGAHLDPAKLPEEYRTLIRTILHLPGKLDHVKRLVALGLDPETPDREGLTALQVAGWEGLPEMMRYLLALSPDLTHVNGYGGGLISTILHGAENNPERARRDHAACVRAALEAGAPLGRNQIEASSDPGLAQIIEDWAASHPDQVTVTVP